MSKRRNKRTLWSKSTDWKPLRLLRIGKESTKLSRELTMKWLSSRSKRESCKGSEPRKKLRRRGSWWLRLISRCRRMRRRWIFRRRLRPRRCLMRYSLLIKKPSSWNNKEPLKSKKKNKKSLTTLTENVARRLNKKQTLKDSRTRKRRKFNAWENNRKKPQTDKPILMPSELKELWKKGTGRTDWEWRRRQRSRRESSRSCTRLESSRCLRRRGEWLSRRSRRGMSSRGFLLNKNYKENKSWKLIWIGRLYFINMLQKSENKFNLKKKKLSKEEQNILRKAENSIRSYKQKSLCSNKLSPRNYKSCTTEE